MTLSVLNSIILTSIILCFPASLFAQFRPVSATAGGRMFSGETLKYEGKINKILRGIPVADLTFSAAPVGANELTVKSEAKSKGTLLKLIGYSFLQQYESTLDIEKFRILKTTKHDVQKQRVRDSEALFNYKDKMVSFVETDPKDRMRPPRRIASEIGEQMYDMISAVYAVRLMPLAVGKKYEFPVSDSGLVYKVPFTVTGHELQKTVLGKIWCWRVEPDIFGAGRLIEQKGKMVIWMTDDALQLPIRAEVQTSLGKVDIKLKSYTKSETPIALRP